MIDKEEFEKASFEENQKFIKKILKLATHNAFTKDDLLFLIKWQNAIIEKMKCCGNCTHHYIKTGEDYFEYECKKRDLCLDDFEPCQDWELAE